MGISGCSTPYYCKMFFESTPSAEAARTAEVERTADGNESK